MRLELEVLEAPHLPIEGVRLSFDSDMLNVLRGRNACGKSLAARLLYVSATGDRESASLLAGGVGDVVRWAIRVGGRTYRYSIRLRERVVWRDRPGLYEVLDEEELEELGLGRLAGELRQLAEERRRSVWRRVRVGGTVYRVVYDYLEGGIYAVPQEPCVHTGVEVRGQRLAMGLELFNFHDPDLGSILGYKLVEGEPLLKLLHYRSDGPLTVEHYPLDSVPRDLKYICVKRRYCARRGWLDWMGPVDIEELLRSRL